MNPPDFFPIVYNVKEAFSYFRYDFLYNYPNKQMEKIFGKEFKINLEEIDRTILEGQNVNEVSWNTVC